MPRTRAATHVPTHQPPTDPSSQGPPSQPPSLTVLPLLRFSWADTIGRTGRPDWDHLQGRGEIHAVFDTVTNRDASLGSLRKKQLLKVVRGMDVLEHVYLDHLKYLAALDQRGDDSHEISDSQRHLMIVAKKPMLAMRYLRESQEVRRFQLNFRPADGFDTACRIFREFGLEIRPPKGQQTVHSQHHSETKTSNTMSLAHTQHQYMPSSFLLHINSGWQGRGSVTGSMEILPKDRTNSLVAGYNTIPGASLPATYNHHTQPANDLMKSDMGDRSQNHAFLGSQIYPTSYQALPQLIPSEQDGNLEILQATEMSAQQTYNHLQRSSTIPQNEWNFHRQAILGNENRKFASSWANQLHQNMSGRHHNSYNEQPAAPKGGCHPTNSNTTSPSVRQFAAEFVNGTLSRQRKQNIESSSKTNTKSKRPATAPVASAAVSSTMPPKRALPFGSSEPEIHEIQAPGHDVELNSTSNDKRRVSGRKRPATATGVINQSNKAQKTAPVLTKKTAKKSRVNDKHVATVQNEENSVDTYKNKDAKQTGHFGPLQLGSRKSTSKARSNVPTRCSARINGNIQRTSELHHAVGAESVASETEKTKKTEMVEASTNTEHLPMSLPKPYMLDASTQVCITSLARSDCLSIPQTASGTEQIATVRDGTMRGKGSLPEEVSDVTQLVLSHLGVDLDKFKSLVELSESVEHVACRLQKQAGARITISDRDGEYDLDDIPDTAKTSGDKRVERMIKDLASTKISFGGLSGPGYNRRDWLERTILMAMRDESFLNLCEDLDEILNTVDPGTEAG